jgi:hypothetical protein
MAEKIPVRWNADAKQRRRARKFYEKSSGQFARLAVTHVHQPTNKWIGGENHACKKESCEEKGSEEEVARK